MGITISGGAGFVGLNLAEAALSAGQHVTLIDRAPPPPSALATLRSGGGQLDMVTADVRDPAAAEAAMGRNSDVLVLAAAVTADRDREARDPEEVLGVNLGAQPPLLRAARDAGVRRVINVSSASAYGRTGFRLQLLREDDPAEPESLYAITKLASEQVLARLGNLWDVEVVSVRLSAVFGPWERDTGVRDTISPPGQVYRMARAGQPALLPRPGPRDWIYAPDVADALLRLAAAPTLAHRLYNVTSPHVWTVLRWGERLAEIVPDFSCRLAGPSEHANVNLHGDRDRAPLDPSRLAEELGWTARHDLADALANLRSREQETRA